jgi:hypothetical protein
MGHEVGNDVSERYDKLASSASKRREIRNRVGKGFLLPGEATSEEAEMVTVGNGKETSTPDQQ